MHVLLRGGVPVEQLGQTCREESCGEERAGTLSQSCQRLQGCQAAGCDARARYLLYKTIVVVRARC